MTVRTNAGSLRCSCNRPSPTPPPFPRLPRPPLMSSLTASVHGLANGDVAPSAPRAWSKPKRPLVQGRLVLFQLGLADVDGVTGIDTTNYNTFTSGSLVEGDPGQPRSPASRTSASGAGHQDRR